MRPWIRVFILVSLAGSIAGCPLEKVVRLTNNSGSSVVVVAKNRRVEWGPGETVEVAPAGQVLRWDELESVVTPPKELRVPVLSIERSPSSMFRYELLGRPVPEGFAETRVGMVIFRLQLERDFSLYILKVGQEQTVTIEDQPPGYPITPSSDAP